jgi:nucleotide-binding universal stress UspA family protein
MMFKHILLPTDGSPLSDKGVLRGLAFAKRIKARVTTLHVVPEFRALADDTLFPSSIEVRQRFLEEARARGQRIVDKVAKKAKAAGVRCKVVIHPGGLPHEEIINTARREKCDLILMASHGRRGLSSVLLGTETSKVLTHSKVPVLVVR